MLFEAPHLTHLTLQTLRAAEGRHATATRAIAVARLASWFAIPDADNKRRAAACLRNCLFSALLSKANLPCLGCTVSDEIVYTTIQQAASRAVHVIAIDSSTLQPGRGSQRCGTGSCCAATTCLQASRSRWKQINLMRVLEERWPC